jgi:hypothetical protein
MNVVMIAALLTFLVEFLYYTVEQKSDVVLISTGNIATHRKNSIIILVFGTLSIFMTIYDDGLIVRNLITGTIFGFLGLRGVLFTRQTVASIRIFKEGFEYGFWDKFVGWDKILDYKISADGCKIEIEKSGLFWKNISVKFDNNLDLKEFEIFLKNKLTK